MTDKPSMPDSLRVLAEQAQKRVRTLGTTAPISEMAPDADKEAFGLMSSPFAPDEWELWACLLLDTFGTRHFSIAHAFMRQLGNMIPVEWDETNGRRIYDSELFQLALGIVSSLRPRNEAEAALAVHCVALHIASIKVSKNMGAKSWLDPKDGAALAAITKAYAAQVQALHTLRKPTSAKRQVIKVQKSVTINYDARQVTLPRGGSGNQRTNPTDAASYAHARGAANAASERPSLSCSDSQGVAVPQACIEGKAAVPITRGQGRCAQG